MASTDAGICNLALLKVGEKQFIDRLDQNTISAKACNVCYATSRDSLLEAYPWTFATRHALLDLLEDHTTTAVTMRTSYRYIYVCPADMLPNGQRYLDVGNPALADLVPFDVEDDAVVGPILLTDQEDAELVYTRRVTEVGKMPNLFQEALAWKIAFELTFAIPVKNALREGMVQGFESAIAQAAISCFKHITPAQKPKPSAIRFRR